MMVPPRHFISTAANVGFSQDAVQLMLDMAAKAKTVMISVAADLPAGFPAVPFKMT
jgi:serine/threonine-protein kinase HipA